MRSPQFNAGYRNGISLNCYEEEGKCFAVPKALFFRTGLFFGTCLTFTLWLQNALLDLLLVFFSPRSAAMRLKKTVANVAFRGTRKACLQIETFP
ncbi:hypothetical protein [Robiginitalea biformata]|uniref:hypothetical protein n=1 Tax=Robiginitalea biformata TaxID=252307 RepID=UPI003B5CD628